jgi:hypothetical protein
VYSFILIGVAAVETFVLLRSVKSVTVAVKSVMVAINLSYICMICK